MGVWVISEYLCHSCLPRLLCQLLLAGLP
jgi:hypothetical protein